MKICAANVNLFQVVVILLCWIIFLELGYLSHWRCICVIFYIHNFTSTSQQRSGFFIQFLFSLMTLIRIYINYEL